MTTSKTKTMKQSQGVSGRGQEGEGGQCALELDGTEACETQLVVLGRYWVYSQIRPSHEHAQ